MPEQLALEFAPAMTPEERHVYSLLPWGRPRAVSVDVLSRATGLSDVKVRALVRDLIMDHGILVASVTTAPAGFFRPETGQEILDATRALRHRGIAILARAARLQKSSIEIVFNQARLEMGGGQNAER